MLADQPLSDPRRFKEQDRFEFAVYADALATVLDHKKTGTPLTMAINAPWGAGKTTLANMIAEHLKERPRARGEAPHIICWFNAWMHDDAPNLATAFVSQISRTANEHRDPILRLLDPLPSAVLRPVGRTMRRLLLTGVAIGSILLSLWWAAEHLQHIDAVARHEADRLTTYEMTNTVSTDATGNPATRSESETVTRTRERVPPPPTVVPDDTDRVLGLLRARVVGLGAFLTAVAGLITLIARFVSVTSLGGFITAPEKAAESGAIQVAQQRLRRLIGQATWRGNRFVVFVDDIERCTPPRSIDVLDAINQLMDHPRVVVVLLGDMSTVAASAQLKYKELAAILAPSSGVAPTGAERGKEAFGRLYLEKIVQFQFDLPIPPPETIRRSVSKLVETRTEEKTSGTA
jgi:hypothetical protein